MDYKEFKELTAERVNDDGRFHASYRDCYISVMKRLRNGSLVGLSVEWACHNDGLTIYHGELFQDPEKAVQFARQSIEKQLTK